MSTASVKFEATNVADRLSVVLQGRDLYPWGYSVGLSRSAIYRLTKGDLPDAEALIPACRIDRLSLSWLLDGIGSPFCVFPADSDATGARYVEERLRDEPTQLVTLVHSDIGYCVLLSKPVTVSPAKGQPYQYTSIDVISGGALGPVTLHVLMEVADVWSRLREVSTTMGDWSALSNGTLGNPPLLGADMAKQGLTSTAAGTGLLARARRLYRNGPGIESVQKIAEPRGVYGTIAPEEAELLHIFRGLGEGERSTVLMMLRALRRPPAP